MLPEWNRQRGGKLGRRQPGLASDGIETVLYARRTQRLLQRGAALAGKRTAGLISAVLSVVETELASHSVQVAGQRGQVLQRFHGFFRALSCFGGQLRDLP